VGISETGAAGPVRFKPGLRRVWRGPGTLQIGLSRRHGTVISGLSAGELPLLERLKEGVPPSSPDLGRGPAAARGRRLLDLLAEAGALVESPSGDVPPEAAGPAARLLPDALVWSVVHPGAGDGWGVLAARAARTVRVAGGGRLALTLATVLTGAGVGQVTVTDPHRVTPGDVVAGGASVADVGHPAAEAAAEAARRLGTPGPRNDGPLDPDVVVLVEHGAADATKADALVSADVPHLSVVVREDGVVVGPLVRPGEGPCLRCLDLHRTDRDPAWPSVLTQVLNPTADVPRPEESAVSTLAAGLAALQVLAELDGVPHPSAAGATLEVELPDGLVARRVWPAHVRCGCVWPPGRPVRDPRLAALTGPGGRRGDPGRTMEP
jgi:bacteriocin biosynthesis cyclodehydratase domain-containing protein